MKPQKLPVPLRVKPIYRHVIRDEWFRTFTPWERLRIALGFNLLVYIRIPCRHNPADHKPIVAARTTKHTTPDSHLIETLEQAVKDCGAEAQTEIFPPPTQSESQTVERVPD